jgi:hypothetical protein
MNPREALREAWATWGTDEGLDRLAELERTDPELAAKTRALMKKNSMHVAAPGRGDTEVALVEDRGRKVKPMIQTKDGHYEVYGDGEHRDETFGLTDDYALAMAARGSVRVGRNRLRR